ncbi:nucleoside transporter-domain-containing protein [Kalaharituber pfeilii]|nr:nucleoside transporter-domain-containing protein [Kalaharituber pfeilii]
MDSIKKLFRSPARQYQPLPETNVHQNDHDHAPRDAEDEVVNRKEEASSLEYAAFLILGVAMLWSWNMFMACATYFQRRFATNAFILKNFQSLFLLVTCATNFSTALYLSSPTSQRKADYPGRISRALKINSLAFTALAFSTLWRSAGPAVYLVFTLLMVFASSLATGMMQNGAFSWVNLFAPINAQAFMAGQAVAGVLPGAAQILSILLVPATPPKDKVSAEDLPVVSPLSAFCYFLTATTVSIISLVALSVLRRRRDVQQLAHSGDIVDTEDGDEPEERSTHERTTVSFWVLFQKLSFHAFGVFFTFTVSMIFPVYTQTIVSVRPITSQSRFFQPDIFIPWSFMIWNTGDLTGRILCAYPSLRISRPKRLAFFSLCRLVYIPLYRMCNIGGRGATFNSDIVYWIIQFTFGMSNGWVGSCNLMAAPMYVGEKERVAAGGFMTTWLIGGLMTGSLLSFFVVL